MKRMKKKVVAMVTLAMFLVTLLPMAAFAGTKNELTVTGETAVTVNNDTEITVEVDGTIVKNAEVWAEKVDVEGIPVKSADFSNEAGDLDEENGILKTDLGDGKLFVKFSAPGEYVVKAGYYVQLPGGQQDFVEFGVTEAITVDGIGVKSVKADPVTVAEDEKNGVETTPVTVTVEPETGANKADLKGYEVSIVNNYESRGLQVVDVDGEAIDSVLLDAAGQAIFYVTAEDYTPAGVYNFTLKCNDVKGTAKVTVAGEGVVEDRVAKTIKAVDVEKVITNEQLDLVQFEIRNAAGDLIDPEGEPALGDAAENFDRAKYLKVVKQPKGMKLNIDNIDFVQNVDTEVMEMVVSKQTLNAGDYSIKMVLKNGKAATVSFTVGEFDADNIVSYEIVADKDEIALDGAGKGSVNYYVNAIDENGITEKVNAPDYYSAYVPATNDVVAKFAEVGDNKKTLSVEPTEGVEKDDILGTEVTLLVVVDNVTLTKDFTLVDTISEGAADYELVFDETEGTVLTNNVVTPKVVSKEDNDQEKKESIEFLYANIISQSNEDANVDVQVEGKAIQIYSDKDTTVEVQVIARTADQAAYAATLTYKIGENAPDPEETNTTVVMTYGSTNMIVNNKVVDMKDAAPFAQDNRTFVPFRALGEALGATVEYKAEDKTVTYELEGTKIVMTLGEKTYTVNGAEKTMDVAPFAKDNRTYVPVRFVGEALGFEVTALENGNGQYVGVAFTK